MPLPTPAIRHATPWFVRAGQSLRVLSVTYAIVLILAMAFENQLVYMPARHPAGDWKRPGENIEDVFLTAADGTRVHGWFAPCESAIASVLFLHGNGGNLTDWKRTIWQLHYTTRVNVLAIDYRGFGKSEGRPTEAGVLQDARAARRWLARRAGMDERDVVLMGRSLGGGVAVQLAAERGAKALILERTFTSLPDAAFARYPFLPTQRLMKNRFRSAQAIGHYHGPLLQSHGTDDEMIPYSQGQELFASAQGSPKQFITIEGGRHNSPQPEGYYRLVRQFLLSLDAK